MEPREIREEAEYIESMAESLSSHLSLFENMYGKPDTGPETAVYDRNTFFRSMSDIVEKAERTDAHMKHLVGMMYGKGDGNA